MIFNIYKNFQNWEKGSHYMIRWKKKQASQQKRKRNSNPLGITGIFHGRTKLQPVVRPTRIISRFVITWHPVGRATYGQVVGHTDCMHQRGRGCRAPRQDTRSNPIRWEWGWCVTYCDKLCQTLRRRRRLMPANQLANGNIITVGGTVVCVCVCVCARVRARERERSYSYECTENNPSIEACTQPRE